MDHRKKVATVKNWAHPIAKIRTPGLRSERRPSVWFTTGALLTETGCTSSTSVRRTPTGSMTVSDLLAAISERPSPEEEELEDDANAPMSVE